MFKFIYRVKVEVERVKHFFRPTRVCKFLTKMPLEYHDVDNVPPHGNPSRTGACWLKNIFFFIVRRTKNLFLSLK